MGGTNMLRRIIMQNLPSSQQPVDLDVAVNDVFRDMKELGRDTELYDIYSTFKEMNKIQDLVIFSNGTVIATRKGLTGYN